MQRDKANQPGRSNLFSDLEILAHFAPLLRAGHSVNAIAKAGLQLSGTEIVADPDSPQPGAQRLVHFVEGRIEGSYLAKLFRKAEERATPFWLRPGYSGDDPLFNGRQLPASEFLVDRSHNPGRPRKRKSSSVT